MNPKSEKLRRLAERASGVSRSAQRAFFMGEVYKVADNVITFPETPEGTRRYHEERYVVVLQAENVSCNPNLKTILVAPCSSSRPAGPFDHEFETENGFPPRSSVAVYTSLIQPVLKTQLAQRTGKITDEGVRTLSTLVATLLGLASTVDLNLDASDATA